jgi:peptide methionine sulfoxide reductase MsrA
MDRRASPLLGGEVPGFLNAEDYHQQYLAKRGLGSCAI